MWNIRKYNDTITETKKQGGHFQAKKAVSTKEEIYDALADELKYSKESLKSWGRPISDGPDDKTASKLEKLLGLRKGFLGRKGGGKTMKKAKPSSSITDFNIAHIFECLEHMRDYLNSDNVESMDKFIELYERISRHNVAIPTEIFDKIDSFIDETLAPIVYEPTTAFADCYSDDIGTFDFAGKFIPKDKDATNQFCLNYMQTLCDIRQELEDFARDELHPYLI